MSFTRHFSQNEEFFLRFPEPYRMPAIPIHHDVRTTQPAPEYLGKLKAVLEVLSSRVPALFAGLSYFFDPARIFSPAFYRLYAVGGERFLYLLRLDLSYRPSLHAVVVPGDNDTSPAYATDCLFLESMILPLEGMEKDDEGSRIFRFRRIVSDTWIGERGRGYATQGVWIDKDLTRYVSKLFLPAGVRLYPYQPFICAYHSIGFSLLHCTPEKRKRQVILLKRALRFLIPHMRRIEGDLTGQDFSEALPSFQMLKKHVPSSWFPVFLGYAVTAYLNDRNQKEFRIDLPPE